ncbi:MAG: hypothetical protein H7221_07140 [Flavobacterium sp.]|nr:hypothetical protein [Flavobacterium sp.]
MLKLHPLYEQKLLNLEFGQHYKSVVNNIGLIGDNTVITDVIVQNYVSNLKTKSIDFDNAMVQIAKSDESVKIAAADVLRDDAIRSALRYLLVFELTKDASKKLAYDSLDTVFNAYKGLQNFNFEQETNAIVNLVAELSKPKYAAHVATLKMEDFVDEMTQTNADFNTLFEGRTQESSVKVVYDVKTMRAEMQNVAHDLNGYVLYLAKAKPADLQYIKVLNVINTVRKYYSDLLAKRTPVKKGETPAPIPPMV